MSRTLQNINDVQTKNIENYRLNIEKSTRSYLLTTKRMTKEKILLMIEKLLKIYEERDDNDPDFEDNNLIELIWEDEDGNWIYKFKS